MAKFIAHFITAEYGVLTRVFNAATATSAKNKAATWAERATRWGDVPIIVETFTARKLDALTLAVDRSRAALNNTWRRYNGTFIYCAGRRGNARDEARIIEIYSVLAAQQEMLNALNRSAINA